MRVLYFHQHFSTPHGAGGTRSYEMARRLIQAGHSVTMVCGSSARADTGLRSEFAHGRRTGVVDGIQVIELQLPYSNIDRYLKRTWTFLRFAMQSVILALRQDYDLIFATSTPLTAGIPGIAARWLRRKPFVFEVRDLWPELPRAMGVITNPLILGAMSALEKLTYKSADGLVALSPGMVAGIVRVGIEKENVRMIPNGCDLDIFRPKDRSPPSGEPERFDRGFVATFAGAHGIANGLDAVLDGARELKRLDRTDIRLLLVGDGNEKERLQHRAEMEELDNVEFLAPIPKAELANLFQYSNAGLMILKNIPAFYQGTSPNKFFDYISAGIPVLCNYPGWISDMISRYECGISVRPDSSRDFAMALIRLADDNSLAARLGENARLLAEKEFSRDLLGARFVDFLVAVLGRVRR